MEGAKHQIAMLSRGETSGRFANYQRHTDDQILHIRSELHIPDH
jgi:hypothetical protein